MAIEESQLREGVATKLVLTAGPKSHSLNAPHHHHVPQADQFPVPRPQSRLPQIQGLMPMLQGCGGVPVRPARDCPGPVTGHLAACSMLEWMRAAQTGEMYVAGFVLSIVCTPCAALCGR